MRRLRSASHCLMIARGMAAQRRCARRAAAPSIQLANVSSGLACPMQYENPAPTCRDGASAIVLRGLGLALHSSSPSVALMADNRACRASRSTASSGCTLVCLSRPKMVMPSRAIISRHSRARTCASNAVVSTAFAGGGSNAGHAHRVLHRALARAVTTELVPRNVVSIVKPPKVEDAEIESLHGDQISALLKALDGHPLHAIAVLTLSTGARRGEILGLAWPC